MKTNKRVWDKWISQCEAVPLEDIYNEKYLFADGIFWGLAFFYELNVRYKKNPQSILKRIESGLLIDYRDRKFGFSMFHRMFDDNELFFQKLSDLSRVDFLPPKGKTKKGLEDLLVYARALARFYNDLQWYGPWKKQQEKIAVIELSMAKVADAASRFFAHSDRGFFDIASRRAAADHRNQAKKKYADKRKQQIIERYFSIKNHVNMRPYTIAQLIQKRYVLTGQNDKRPSLRTIVRRLREENLVIK